MSDAFKENAVTFLYGMLAGELFMGTVLILIHLKGQL